MKRFVAAGASALALFVAGTAAAGVPDSGREAPQPVDVSALIEKGAALPSHALTSAQEKASGALRRAGLVRRGNRTRFPNRAATAASPAPAEQNGAVTAEPAHDSAASTNGESQSPQAVKAAQAAEAPGLFPGLPGTGHAGYASGSVIHADALQSGGTRVVNADVAFSGASFSSAKLSAAVANEMSRVVAPALDAGSAFGRGTGLEAGLGIGESAPNQVVLPEAVEAKAPPSTGLLKRTAVPAEGDPLVAAQVLRGEAQSLGGAACTTGVDLSFGLGHVADLGLLNAGTAEAPARVIDTEAPEALEDAVSQSRSATRLVAQSGTQGVIKKLGLQSEVRQTIAPVTFFEGTEQAFTIRVLGEWVLRATADGKEGSIFYGPGTVEPQTPVLQILDAGGEAIEEIFTQDLFGKEGLDVTVPGVAQITIGENPRAIGGDTKSEATETATQASAAVDVVRVRLLDQGDTMRAADVRIGHLEAAVAVPEGGITCGIGLTKQSVPEFVTPGQSFKWVLNVTNPNDCLLSKIKLEDTISVDNPLLKYTVKGATDGATVSNTQVIWNDLGSLETGKSKEVTIDVDVAPDSQGGMFTDKAVVTGVCGPVPLQGEAAGGAGATAGAVSIPLQAEVTLNAPQVAVLQAAAEVPLLPRTGRDISMLLGVALVGTGAGVFLKAVSRRRKTSV